MKDYDDYLQKSAVKELMGIRKNIDGINECMEHDISKELSAIRKNLEIIAAALCDAVRKRKEQQTKSGLNIEKTPDISTEDVEYSYIIAVDFDGTLVEDEYPNIGKPKKNIIDYIKLRQGEGAKIVLWTTREGQYLIDAVRWCADNDIYLDAVNDNVPEIIQKFGVNCRKIFAHEYIDDRACSTLTIV